MAEKKSSGFRFRLPWLLQPTLTSRPAVAPEPPRTTTQTSVSSAPAQRPPFRPPGRAPATVAPPSTTSLVATPAPPPASPTRAQTRSASSPPPVPAKSSPPRSAIAKIPDPVANKPTKETQTTSQIATANDGETQPTKEVATPATPPAIDKVAAAKPQTTSQTPDPVAPLAAARTAAADESQPTKQTQAAKGTATPPAVDKVAATVETQTTSQTPAKAVPSAAARTATAGGTQATTERAIPTTPPAIAKVANANETRTTTETPGPPVALVAATAAEAGGSQPTKETQAATEMASPATPPAIAKVANTIETQPAKEAQTTTGTKPTVETPAPTTLRQSPPFRPSLNIQPLQTGTSPRSPSRIASQPTDKPSSSSVTTTAVLHNTPEIKRPTDTIHVPQGADFALDAKPKEIAKLKGVQTKSSNPHSTDNKITKTKSQKPIESDRVSLHREIKDDIFKFIRKIATNPSKQYTDEKPESIVTVAGDNTGASMHLASDVTDRSVRDSAINGEGSSNGKKSRRGSENQETTAIVNSNSQGINNSMMFNSSVTERNPGVHLGFSRNLANGKDSKMENRESMESHRAEANISPQQTLVFDPAIGGCIEGVSMEGCELEEDDYGSKGYEIEVV